jgi:hypothetical protein
MGSIQITDLCANEIIKGGPRVACEKPIIGTLAIASSYHTKSLLTLSAGPGLGMASPPSDQHRKTPVLLESGIAQALSRSRV